MIPTSTALMRIDAVIPGSGTGKSAPKDVRCTRGLVLIELVIVVVIMSLMTAIATLSLSGAIGRTKFQKQAHAFINVLKMAQNAAAESDRRYAVALDFDEQTYTLRQLTSLDLEELLEEEPVITSGNFTDQCRLDYVVFDDGDDTRDRGQDAFRAWFFAGHAGWQYGAKIVLLDDDGNPHSVLINRLSRVITLQPGDVEIMEPKYKEDIPF